jgi:hypothetical protein
MKKLFSILVFSLSAYAQASGVPLVEANKRLGCDCKAFEAFIVLATAPKDGVLLNSFMESVYGRPFSMLDPRLVDLVTVGQAITMRAEKTMTQKEHLRLIRFLAGVCATSPWPPIDDETENSSHG